MRLFPRLAAAILAAAPLAAQDEPYRTPRAGEAAGATVFGAEIEVAPRDRTRATELNLGAVLLPGGPSGLGIGATGGLYLWRVTPSGRIRGVLAGISNELRIDTTLGARSPWSAVGTLDSLTLPWARSEYVQGKRLREEELERLDARAGVGLAWRVPLGPKAVDNGFDAALTLEAGGLWFRRGERTDPSFVLPEETSEARLHLRLRADAITRNLLELPHAGWSAGLDGVAARRGRWEPWGMPGALETGGRSWQALSGFAFVALGVPGLSERHRLVGSLHAGTGVELDRFSAFRLGSGSTWGDFETLSRLVLPAAGIDEIATSRYLIADLEYRVEIVCFLFAQLRGTLAWADVPEGEKSVKRTRSFPALTLGMSSGLPWNLVLELAGSWNAGLEQREEGRIATGRSGLLVSLTKVF